MRIDLRVEYNDGTAVDTAAVTADLVAFEDAFNRSIAKLRIELRLKDVCWLAWQSLTRRGLVTAPFAEWLLTVDDAQLTSGEAEPVPLDRPKASTSA